MTSPLAHKPTLTGSRIELRPFDAEAIDAMIEILQEPEVLVKTGTVHSRSTETHPFNEAKTREWYSRRNDKKNRLDLAIFALDQQKYVGEVAFNEYDPDNGSVNYRIAIGQAGQNKGYGTEATKLMVDYGFEKLGLHRIELEVLDFNERAKHVYTSCGFVPEGRRREAFLIDGEYHDAVLKAVLHSDWEAARSVAGHLALDLKRVEI
ncbi:GNAT family N-acetyltransferase [Rothia nasimurium]|uniref:GNAT family N-acetyltransferase n=1 Tax=Rothia nasimurium TaxID=85336 RepID=UPI001F1F1FF7|nr:GNAT family protein [Rothia nasimurium]